MSKRKSGRNIHGILLLDKPLGVSSNRILQQVKRLYNANKGGHTGSLDPLATGLLPLCFGEATKISAMLLDENKRYQVVVKLGVVTNTGDSEGEVIRQSAVPHYSQAEVETCLKRFRGEIEQVPPMYSALKHQGKKLYELAREGKTIDRKARTIRIHELELLSQTADTLSLNVFCSKGTYIRSLAEDIGLHLGCGASVAELRRTQVGQFDIKNALTIEQLQEMDLNQLQQCLLEVDQPLHGMPIIQLSHKQASLIRHGQQITVEKLPQQAAQGLVRMYNKQMFIGLGELLLNDKLVPKKIFNLESEAA